MRIEMSYPKPVCASLSSFIWWIHEEKIDPKLRSYQELSEFRAKRGRPWRLCQERERGQPAEEKHYYM